nr:MAG TPA: hypothetical protein [Caudoviricetes sp.]
MFKSSKIDIRSIFYLVKKIPTKSVFFSSKSFFQKSSSNRSDFYSNSFHKNK